MDRREAGGARRGAGSQLEALPPALLLAILQLVPADTRVSLALVSPALRAALAALPAELWARLDLSSACGFARVVSDATLQAYAQRFAERAGGRLTALDLSDCHGVTREALLAVVRANPGVELTLCHTQPRMLSFDAVTRLLGELPAHASLRLSLDCQGNGQARAVMGPSDPRIRAVNHLRVTFLDQTASAAMLTDLVNDVAACVGGVPQLTLLGTQRTELAALVDGALAHRLPFLSLQGCALPDGAAALERLLRDGASLRELHLRDSRPLFDVTHADCALARGLAANANLRVLSLRGCRVWDRGSGPDGHGGHLPHYGMRMRMDATLALLAALAAHPSLRTLNLADNEMWYLPGYLRDATTEASDAVAGAALASLLRAPALLELDLSRCMLRPGVLAPLFAALRGTTTVRVLNCADDHDPPPAALVLDVLAPAVAANVGLRELHAGRGAEHVEHVVAEREAARLRWSAVHTLFG